MKSRLCRPSWRAFASTHPLVLPSTSSKEVLFACPPSPPWSLPFFTLESTLFFPFSGFNPPLSCQVAALAHLDSVPPHDLVIWTDGSVPFPLAKVTLAWRILHAAPADTRPRTSIISFCIVQLWTLCAALFLATLCIYTISGPCPWELPGYWGLMLRPSEGVA